MLVDSAEIELKAGDGGNGIVSWRREKFIARGGPDGGDGGNGGSIYIVATHNADTLSSYRYRKTFQADNGKSGAHKKKTGPSGDDMELLVPVGTSIINLTDNVLAADLTEDGERFLIVRGGKGGLGNIHFATAEKQNPFQSTQGTPGQNKKVRLELKLVADIALIGEPNAGKSSLIAALTNVQARIAAFPFSTVEPILGVFKKGDLRLTLIDLPGLIAGAHKGRGLGTEFLKHTKRVKGLIHVVDATQPNIDQSIEVITAELEQYDPELTHKPKLLVLNKLDLLNKQEQKELAKKYPQALGVSAKEKQGLEDLISKLPSLLA